MMRARFKLEEPDKCEATMVVTMTVGEWRAIYRILDATPYNTTESSFRRLIRGIIEKADKTYSEVGEK